MLIALGIASLFEHAARTTENDYLAYNNLGFYYSRLGRADEAMANYERWRMSGEFTMVDPLVMVKTGLSTGLQVTAQPLLAFP